MIITVVCCNPERIRQKLICKGGKTIKSIEIRVPEKPKPPPENPKEAEKPKPPPEKPKEAEKPKPPPEKPKEAEKPKPPPQKPKEAEKPKPPPEKPKEAEKPKPPPEKPKEGEKPKPADPPKADKPVEIIKPENPPKADEPVEILNLPPLAPAPAPALAPKPKPVEIINLPPPAPAPALAPAPAPVPVIAVNGYPQFFPVPVYCQPCYEVGYGGPCQHGYGTGIPYQPPSSYDGFVKLVPSYSETPAATTVGWPSSGCRCNRSNACRCEYFTEENPACTIM